MWRDFSGEQEQLDGIAAELAEAGRIARAATVRRELPDPGFAQALRVDLLRCLPTLTVIDGAAVLAPAGGSKAWAREEIRVRDEKAAVARPAPVEPPVPDDGAATDHVAMLQPKVRWQMPARAMPARWVAVGLAASLAIASLMYGTTNMFPSKLSATAQVAVGATLIRGGNTAGLVAGQELREGDEIRVGPEGLATLGLGRSFVRMAPGSDLELASLKSDSLVVDQLAGRAYHRVSVDPGADYAVVTGGVSWTARGTAFDVNRYATEGGGEAVRGLALLNGVDLSGPNVRAQLDQGQSAVVQLRDGKPAGQPQLAPIAPELLTEAWLMQNAQLDRLAGLDLGELIADVSPTPEPTLEPTAAPKTAAPATPAPATPKPTVRPTVKPPAGPVNLGTLKVKANYNGTYTFSWSKYTGSFSFYKLVYGPAGSSPSYPGFDYWACPETWETSWTGAIADGDYSVRLQAIDESSGKAVVKAQTSIVHVVGPAPTLPATQSLGAISAVDNGNGTITLSWSGYSGGWSFSYYKVVYGPVGSNPSYLGSFSGYWATGTDQTSVTFSMGENGELYPGTSWDFRVQAIGYPAGSGFIFGQTSILTYTIPGA